MWPSDAVAEAGSQEAPPYHPSVQREVEDRTGLGVLREPSGSEERPTGGRSIGGAAGNFSLLLTRHVATERVLLTLEY